MADVDVEVTRKFDVEIRNMSEREARALVDFYEKALELGKSVLPEPGDLIDRERQILVDDIIDSLSNKLKYR